MSHVDILVARKGPIGWLALKACYDTFTSSLVLLSTYTDTGKVKTRMLKQSVGTESSIGESQKMTTRDAVTDTSNGMFYVPNVNQRPIGSLSLYDWRKIWYLYLTCDLTRPSVQGAILQADLSGVPQLSTH